jgi:hypothetical protein
MSRIINAFRGDNEIPPEKDVYLMFDGDRLDPSASVGEIELSDMDNLEIYVK